MNISELQARQGNVGLVGTIIEIAEPREFEKAGRKGRVTNATLEDDSGKIILSLWNEDIDRVKVGDRVEIQNGWVSEWQGELQLSAGISSLLSSFSKKLILAQAVMCPAAARSLE